MLPYCPVRWMRGLRLEELEQFLFGFGGQQRRIRFQGRHTVTCRETDRGKFRIEQTEYKGVIYDHTRLAWTCVADDVRIGNTGKMPKDKLIERITSGYEADKRNVNPFTGRPDGDDFDSVQEETEEEIIF